MRTICAVAVAWVALSVFYVAGALGQEDMTVVDNRVFSDPQRPASVFRHDEHNETAGIEACNECHHLYEDGKKLEDESSEDMRCVDCHGLEAQEGQPSLTRAFHLNCKGCHQRQAKGPVLCGECHVKP